LDAAAAIVEELGIAVVLWWYCGGNFQGGADRLSKNRPCKAGCLVYLFWGGEEEEEEEEAASTRLPWPSFSAIFSAIFLGGGGRRRRRLEAEASTTLSSLLLLLLLEEQKSLNEGPSPSPRPSPSPSPRKN
jgi:hypothetical protein